MEKTTDLACSKAFPGSSAGKESACSTGDPGLTLGLGRDRLATPIFLGCPDGSDGKESTCNAGDLGWEDPLEKRTATHSSILDCRIPWTEEPGR